MAPGPSLGGIATQVAALELVLADGLAWLLLRRASAPELFSAARVSRSAPSASSPTCDAALRAGNLSRWPLDEAPMHVDQVLERFDEFAAGNDHFEFYWFPYGRNALVKRNNRAVRGGRRGRDSVAGCRGWRRFLEYEVMENATFGALCRTGRAMPGLIKPLGNRLASATLSTRPVLPRRRIEVFVTPRRVRIEESEYSLPRESVHDVLGRAARGRCPASPTR